MPEKARVFVAEDNPNYLNAFKGQLETAGHSVLLTATTLRDALGAVQQFEQLRIQVAIIDGNLDPNDTSGYDGQRIVDAIGRLAPNIKIVGMSSSSIKGVTVDLGKRNYHKLGETVTNL